MLLMPEKLMEYREEIRVALEEGRPADAALVAPRLSSARVAKILREAPRNQVVPCLLAMDRDKAGRVLGQFPPDFAGELLTESDGSASHLFAQIPVDHAADILGVLEPEKAQQLVATCPPEQRQNLSRLSGYKRDTAGSVMNPHFLAVEPGQTIGQVLDALRSAPPEVERTSYIYVLGGNGRLEGVISVKDLVRTPPHTRVEDAMATEIVAVNVADPAVDAAKLLRNRRFTILPVVDDRNALVGVLTFDDAMDILTEDVADQFAPLGASEESFFTPPLSAVRRRLPWMAGNIFLNLGAVAVITGFEDTIARVAILAAFLPMITDMGGNVGIQSLSVAIRSIALGEVRLRDFARATRKEVTIGLVNGAALGALFAVVAWLWQGDPMIGVIAGIALGINVLLAGVVGGVLPFLIKRLGRDPAMMTGPLLTTITDITGVTIYLGLATLFLAGVGSG